ncbi:MAG: transporter substrate-binding domain-containing protein [Deltaproteobacteria bacterium]|nr:transporter substrate-binding domain-containing protein [Deltaproteobacteria bacterium]
MERPVRIAARVCPPFVMNDAGQYSGLSIFLLDNIAGKLGRQYSIEEYDLKEMLEAVAQGKADVAVSCLSITQKREEIIDFSHSFYETHLAIAVKQHGFLHTLKNFFYNRRLLIVVGIIVGVAALIGGILYLLEHNINDKLYSMKNKGGRLLEAFIAGLLFVTSGPIRYYEFKTLSGRTLTAFLAVGSTVMIASITALLASAFTLDQINLEITGPQDLAKVRVGAMEASTSFEYLQKKGINSRTFSDRKELLAALDDGRLDAVVSDDAILKYMIKKAQAKGRYETLSVLPFVFEKQNYAFALTDESPHVEKLNQALLSARESLEWSAALVKYIGK